jgi:hypothetical protein
MSANSAAYLIERQGADGEEWRPVTYCCSLDYARMVAGFGLRRHIGVAYRARHLQSGVAIELPLEASATAQHSVEGSTTETVPARTA